MESYCSHLCVGVGVGVASLIEVDKLYQVQWGNRSQVDEAVVVDSGTEKDMKQRMEEEQKKKCPVAASRKWKAPAQKTKSGKPMAKVLVLSSPPRTTCPTSASEEDTTSTESNAPEESTTPAPDTPNTPEAATHANPQEDIGDHQIRAPAPNTPLAATHANPQEDIGEHQIRAPAPDTPNTPLAATHAHRQEETGEHQTPTQAPDTPVSVFRATRPIPSTSGSSGTFAYLQSLEASVSHLALEVGKMRRLLETNVKCNADTVIELRETKALVEMLVAQNVALQRGPNTQTDATQPAADNANDNMPDDIHPRYQLDQSEVWGIKEDSSNAGNFAAKLVQKFFPELFGVANLRYNFNWYGGGKLQKAELCPVRKDAIKKYVNYYHPDVTSESVWREREDK